MNYKLIIDCTPTEPRFGGRKVAGQVLSEAWFKVLIYWMSVMLQTEGLKVTKFVIEDEDIKDALSASQSDPSTHSSGSSSPSAYIQDSEIQYFDPSSPQPHDQSHIDSPHEELGSPSKPYSGIEDTKLT